MHSLQKAWNHTTRQFRSLSGFLSGSSISSIRFQLIYGMNSFFAEDLCLFYKLVFIKYYAVFPFPSSKLPLSKR
ncbi:hypothetical protein CHM34_00580 [Paludifilum halophilum]|uniref:Uncharacterized protein n=1 Tax=Paludifilum halophilum TaxID=1642702 RepID=A0A235BB61_9BACL|nr:hypothetical protein CHM34_00580 [Paludifilum halophilum]